MRDQPNAHHLPRRKTNQLDLFTRPDGGGAVQTPEWRALPEETRQALTKLMACLLVEHERDDRRSRPVGGHSDV